MPEGPDTGARRERFRAWLRERAATQVLPAIAITVAALVFLGPGKPRPVLGVRVYGVPRRGPTVALRLIGVRRFLSTDDAAALARVHVEARDGDAVVATWDGPLGSDGVGEAVLRLESAQTPHALDLRISAGSAPLAAGHIDLASSEPTLATLATVDGHASGDIAIRVDTLRGQLAAPFTDRIRISAEGTSGRAAGPIELAIAYEGAKIAPERASVADKAGAVFDVTPQSHTVSLTVTAHAADAREGRWDGYLPVVPGAMWLDPAPAGAGDHAGFRLVSPAPRPRAYVSFFTERGRVFGAAVPLEPDASGFFSAIVSPPIPAGARMLYAVTSGDPLERGTGTVAWPIRPPEGAMPVRRVRPLLDGVPDAEAHERLRLKRARYAGVAVIALAALVQILLLVARSRATERQLQLHLRALSARAAQRRADDAAGQTERADEPTAEDFAALAAAARDESPVLRAAVLIALVALGFVVVAALTTFR